MNFDINQLGPAAAMLAAMAGGLLLLLMETFMTGRGAVTADGSAIQRSPRAYLAALTVGSVIVCMVLCWMAWAQPSQEIFSGMLTMDRFSIYASMIFLVGTGLTALMAPGFLREHRFEFGEFYALLMFACAGMMIMAAGTDFVSIFIGLEMMSLAVYVLCGSWRRSPQSSEAAMKYFIVGAFATAIFLYGVALVYGATGTTNLRAIAQAHLDQPMDKPLMLIGMLNIVVAMGFKVAAVPFHMWAPDAYEGAPTPVTAFMSAGVKAAAFAAIIRIFGVAFNRPELTFGSSGWSDMLAGIAAITMTLGNLAALRQDNVKRMLAYSSISHAGYLLVGIVAMSLVGAEARGPILYYLLAYTLTTMGSFGVVAWIGRRNDERLLLDDWAGLGARHPGAALAMTIFMMSLGGFPPTAGFFGKLYVFRAALTKPGIEWLVVVAVLNSVVSVFYYLRVVMAMYFREPTRDTQPTRDHAMTAVLLIAAVTTLLVGLLPSWFVELANQATFG